MPTLTKLRDRNGSNATVAPNRCRFELLEPRRLLSGNWTTVDDFFASTPERGAYAHAEDMAPDGAGGVYAAGYAYDSTTPPGSAYVRHKSAGSSTWQTVATASSIPGSTYSTRFDEVAVGGPNHDVYLAGMQGSPGNTYSLVIWKGSLNAEGTLYLLTVVENVPVNLPNGNLNPARTYTEDLAADAAGNVFAAGWLTGKGGPLGTSHWIVRKLTAGQSAFVTVDDFLFNRADARASGVTVVPSGTNAGVYVVGDGGVSGTYAGSCWVVRKSTNAGSTWSTVDSFQLEPTKNAPAAAEAIVAHGDGTLHVVGRVSTAVRTGGNNNNPVYRYDHRWYMRSSSNGGSTWSNDDVFSENVGQGAIRLPGAVVTDSAGKVYVAGSVDDQTANSRSIVRSNADGAWSTSDDYQGLGGYTRAYSMTRDSSGSLYVGGESASHWSVRSMTPGALLAPSGGMGASIFADSRIADVNRDRLEQLV